MTDRAPAAAVLDFDRDDGLLLDDQFFGRGNDRIDLRARDPEDVRGLLRDGLAAIDLRTKAPSVDVDGPDGPGALRVIATLEGRPVLGIEDVMLF